MSIQVNTSAWLGEGCEDTLLAPLDGAASMHGAVSNQGANADFAWRVRPSADVVAVMQPYFYPYPGYYRLLSVVDTLVLFDCVQFPRRGRVHRASGFDAAGRNHWLTLPIARAPRATTISGLAFQADAEARFAERMRTAHWLQPIHRRLPEAVRNHLAAPLGNVVDHLEAGIRIVADELALAPKILRSSSLAIDPDLRGQARVMAICQLLNARTYVNSPGGRSLYDPVAFAKRGLNLRYLSPYGGGFANMLQAMAKMKPGGLRAHLEAESSLLR